MEEYQPYPLVLPWSNKFDLPGNPRDRHREFLATLPERLLYFCRFIGYAEPDQELEDLEFRVDCITLLDRWVEDHVTTADGPFVDFDLDRPAGSELPPRKVIYDITPLGESICIDLSLVFAQALINNGPGYEWHFKRKRPTSLNDRAGSTVLRSAMNDESWPWQRCFGFLIAIIQYRERCVFLEQYARRLEVFPLK